MFRLNKSSSGVSKNHKTNYNMSVRICEPSGIPNVHRHILISFMVLRYAWRWLL